MAALEEEADPLTAVYVKEEGPKLYLKKIYDVLVENMGLTFRGCCPVSYRSGFRSKDAIECLMKEGIADNLDESMKMMRTLIKFEFVRLCDTKLKVDDFAYDESQLAKFTHKIHRDPVALRMLEYNTDDGTLLLSGPNLYRVYNMLANMIEIRDRTIGSETYYRCFLGCDAVDCMIDLGIVTDFEAGMKFGQALIDNDLIRFAIKRSDSGSNIFSQQLIFFHFAPKSEVDLMFETKRFDSDEGRFSAVTKADYREIPLEKKKERLKLSIKLLKSKIKPEDVSLCGTMYREIFLNKQLTEALMKGLLAESEEEATMIGQGLIQVGLILNVTDASKPFMLDGKEYYRFVTPISGEQIKRDFESIMMTEKELTDLMSSVLRTLKDKVVVKDRSYRLRKYKSCFLASEAIDALIDSKIVMNEFEGIMQCQRLIDMGKIQHVSDKSKPFANEKLFFRFITE